MENKIKNLSPKARLIRRTMSVALTCAILLIVNHLAMPGLNWGLWGSLGLCASLLFDVIDYIAISIDNKKEE